MHKKLKNIFYIFFPLVIGGIVSLIIKDHIDYTTLSKPPLSPPKWAFPVAWSIIYLLMGIAYYVFRKKYQTNEKTVSRLYYLQLGVNALWSIIFFLFKWRFIAILWILWLLSLIILLMISFKEKEKLSFYLFIPYLVWVLFATYLTIGIYILN